MRPRLILFVLLLSPSILCLSQEGSANRNPQVRNPIEGSRIFQYYCSSCHGTDGRGNGPASAALRHAAPDLTVLSQKNNGKFPYRHVRNVIEGTDVQPVAHGDRKMPAWGPVFHEVDADQDWGEVRLDAVTKHIQSIQQK